MDAYRHIYRWGFRYPWEAIARRRPTPAIERRLAMTQYWSPERLREQQDRDLAELVRHAYESVPFYRARMRAAGLSPTDVTKVADLHKLPILTRQEARAAGESRASTAEPRPIIRKTTSGSTGEPLAFAYDLRSEYWREAVRRRAYGWAGYQEGVRSVHFWTTDPASFDASRLKDAKRTLDRALKRAYFVDSAARDDAALAHVVGELRRRRARVLIAYAQAAADLARYVDQRGRDFPVITVITGAETVFPSDRVVIERALGPLFNTYGSREVMLMASECPAHDGLHVAMENVAIELVVREGDAVRAAEPGESGEVLVTDLHNFGMPFIRYANGDSAVQGSSARCACGRGLARLASVEGRVSLVLRDREGGAVTGFKVNTVVVPVADAILRFQAIQKKDGAVTVRIVPSPSFGDLARSHIETALSATLKGQAVKVELVPTISPGKNGKHATVVIE